MTEGLHYAAEAGHVDQMILSADERTIRQSTEIDMIIRPTHSIPENGALKIRFPPEFTLPTSCSITNPINISPTSTCSSSNHEITLRNAFPELYVPSINGEIRLSIPQIVMPNTSGPSGEFGFFTYAEDSADGNLYEIDASYVDDLIRAIPDVITQGEVLPDSFVTFEETTYTISFVLKNDMVREGQVVIVIPD